MLCNIIVTFLLMNPQTHVQKKITVNVTEKEVELYTKKVKQFYGELVSDYQVNKSETFFPCDGEPSK